MSKEENFMVEFGEKLQTGVPISSKGNRLKLGDWQADLVSLSICAYSDTKEKITILRAFTQSMVKNKS
jgi:hypothetical protein